MCARRQLGAPGGRARLAAAAPGGPRADRHGWVGGWMAGCESTALLRLGDVLWLPLGALGGLVQAASSQGPALKRAVLALPSPYPSCRPPLQATPTSTACAPTAAPWPSPSSGPTRPPAPPVSALPRLCWLGRHPPACMWFVWPLGLLPAAQPAAQCPVPLPPSCHQRLALTSSTADPHHVRLVTLLQPARRRPTTWTRRPPLCSAAHLLLLLPPPLLAPQPARRWSTTWT